MRSRISTKFASKASTNQSQVRRGGIVAGPGPGAAPGPLGAGGTRPAGAESLLRRVCGLVVFMVTSSGAPSPHIAGGDPPHSSARLDEDGHHRKTAEAAADDDDLGTC